MSVPFLTVPDRVGPWDWVRGGLAGFIGGVGFGIFMMFIMPPPVLEVAIPNMYGFEATPDNPAYGLGWFFHQFHAVMLGLGYVAYAESGPARSLAEPRAVGGGILHAIIWGVATTVVMAVIVMPIWLQLAGFAGAPPFPNLSFPGTLISLIGHIIYALAPGILYAMYRTG